MANWIYTDEEVNQQYETATKIAEERSKAEPHAVEAFYDKVDKRIVVNLNSGCTFAFPAKLIKEFITAVPEDIAAVEITPSGYGLHWEKLDADYSIPSLLAGIFGTKAWMAEQGRKGGSVTSEAKAIAARTNGQKGGRPKMKSVKE